MNSLKGASKNPLNNSASNFVFNSIDTLSTSQASFFSNLPKFLSHPLLEEAFKNNSFEIFQFLDKDDLLSLKRSNKYFKDIIDCYELFVNSIDCLGQLFNMTINEVTEPLKKKSKVREKFNFNKPMETHFKNTKQYITRIQCARKKTKK